MSRQTYFRDEGLILKKTQLKDAHQLISIFTRNHGRLVLTAYGTKKLTSRRLSHLETGNVIAFSWREKGEFLTLQETELKYAHSKIKDDPVGLNVMYDILALIQKIVPEQEPQEKLYSDVLAFFRRMHKGDNSHNAHTAFMTQVLIQGGYVSEEEAGRPTFNPLEFVEDLIGQKIRK